MMTTPGRLTNDPDHDMTRARGPGSGGRSERFTSILRALELDRKITRDRVLELAGVGSPSSFKRIKRELKVAGMPLTYDPSDGYYHVPPEASIARYGIDPRARAQLAQVRTAVSALGGVAAEALEDFLEVLDARIALEDPASIAVFTSRHPQPRGGPEFYSTLDRALSAVREHRWLSFDYKPTAGGERSARTIAPQAVHSHDGRYYVWGTLEGDATAFPSPRLFALDRASEVVIEDDTFAVDTSLHLDDALRYSFGTMVSSEKPQEITVRFAPEAVAFAACRTWPAERARFDEPDGGLRLVFEVSTIVEIVAWVLSFGGTATIVSPPGARDELRRRAQTIVNASS
jgi:predicted DNA-binding transcriptional regulator YafY